MLTATHFTQECNGGCDTELSQKACVKTFHRSEKSR